MFDLKKRTKIEPKKEEKKEQKEDLYYTLDWENLKWDLCPKCEFALTTKKGKGIKKCLSGCGFKIRIKRFNQLVMELHLNDLRQEHRENIKKLKEITRT